MQHELNHIVQTLLGSQNLDEVSRENLASLTREFPYSPILHLLYSKKLQLAQDPHFAESVAQTALYFSNPHWLNSLLRPKSSRDAVVEMENAYAQTHHAEAVPEPMPVHQEVQPVIQEPVEVEARAIAQEQTAEEPITEIPFDGMTEMATAEPAMEAAIAPGQEPITEAPFEALAEMSAAETSVEEVRVSDQGPITEASFDALAEMSAAETSVEEVRVSDQEPITEAPFEALAEMSAAETSVEEVRVSDQEPITEAPFDGMAELSVPAPTPAESTVDEEVKHWSEPDIRVLDQPLEGIPQDWPAKVENERPDTYREQPLEQKEPAVGTGETVPAPPLEEKKSVHEPAQEGLIPIEPLYTIDYFASQGIQLTDEEKLDPLGRKLKSFTEWLKTMKKVHPEKTKMSMDDKTEGSIKEGAEHSNDRAEVVTEAMAEVYLKQGLKHKALEVYQKLSLLNPSHSASFAAKIAELKATEL